jgi:hypothetical protein
MILLEKLYPPFRLQSRHTFPQVQFLYPIGSVYLPLRIIDCRRVNAPSRSNKLLGPSMMSRNVCSRISALIFYLCAAAALSACTTDDRSDLEAAISRYHNNHAFCIPLPFNAATLNNSQFGADDDLLIVPDAAIPSMNQTHWEALVSAGLIAPDLAPPGNKVGEFPASYRLTKDGHLSFQALTPKNTSAIATGHFCYAHANVDAVFPLALVNDDAVMVAYSYRMTGRAAWSFDPALVNIFPRLRYDANAQFQDLTVLIHLDNVWTDTRALPLSQGGRVEPEDDER